MSTDYSNQNFLYQNSDYNPYYFNPGYYEQTRQTVTPPHSINSSGYSISPNQSTSSVNTSFYSSPQSTYTNQYAQNYQLNLNPNYYYNQSFYNTDYAYNYYQVNKSTDYEQSVVQQKESVMKKLSEQELDENEEETVNETNKKRRIRTQFTFEQRKFLLTIFAQTIYPSKEQLEIISVKLGVSTSVLQTWFKNTRSKQKKLTHTKNL